MEVPRLGLELELQLALAIVRANQDPSWSVTYTTAHDNARSLTHSARPGIEPTSSWILVRFISTEPQQELLTTKIPMAYFIELEQIILKFV